MSDDFKSGDLGLNVKNNDKNKHKPGALSALLGHAKDSDDDLGLNFVSGFGDGR